MSENMLEHLTSQDKDNYYRYLLRMALSIAQSSKGLIAYFAATGDSVLDVGCGSGPLMKAIEAVNPNAEIIGIDINKAAVDACTQQGLNAIYCSLKDYVKTGKKVKIIIFSSVLHEFSSYDEKAPFKEDAIVDAIKDAYDILEPGGAIIIRDGIRVDKSTSDKRIRINFLNPEDSVWVEKFKEEFPDYKKLPEETEGVLSAENAKEFLSTYTWGEGSWNREVQERFGILTESRWKEILRSEGFRIRHCMTSSEEYQKYLEPKIEITSEIEMLLEEMTILMVAEKK